MITKTLYDELSCEHVLAHVYGEHAESAQTTEDAPYVEIFGEDRFIVWDFGKMHTFADLAAAEECLFALEREA